MGREVVEEIIMGRIVRPIHDLTTASPLSFPVPAREKGRVIRQVTTALESRSSTARTVSEWLLQRTCEVKGNAVN